MRTVMVRSALETLELRVIKNAQALTGEGYHVTLLSWDRDCEYPETERKDSYEVRRFRFRAPYGPRVLIYLPIWWSFELFWLLRKRWDVVHAMDFDTVVPAVIAARIKKKPVIYEMVDTYEDVRALPRVLRKIAMAIDKIFIRLADAIIITDEARIEEFGGIPNDNTVVIYNSPPDIFHQVNHPTQRDGAFTIFYAGGMQRKGRGNPDRVFQAIKDIDDTRLVIAGWGKQVKEIRRLVDEDPNRVQFLGRISYAEVLERTMIADILIALYPPAILNSRYTSACKLFEAMMCSKPILVSRGTATASIVEKENCGLVVDYDSIEQIRDAIVKLKADPQLCRQLGANGRRAYENRYSWEMMEQRLVDLYRKLNSGRA